ncbi:MAG TPA: hypothetical protein V6D43_05980 [Candidatus Sericytochromatia bacterium]
MGVLPELRNRRFIATDTNLPSNALLSASENHARSYALQAFLVKDLSREFLIIALPSLSDKLTSLRGYSQRKIKVLPQTDGRELF